MFSLRQPLHCTHREQVWKENSYLSLVNLSQRLFQGFTRCDRQMNETNYDEVLWGKMLPDSCQGQSGWSWVCSFIKTMIINKTHMDHDDTTKITSFYHKMNIFPLNVGEGRTFFPFIPPWYHIFEVFYYTHKRKMIDIHS